MSEEFIIDTTQNLMRQESQARDPYDHLDAVEWVQKQVEYGEQDTNISGRGLVEPISKLEGDLVGCEIGVCHGFTTELWVKKIPNIKKIYAIDNYPSFVDWDGTRVTEDRQAETKRRCIERLEPYKDKIEFIFDTSENAAFNMKEDSLDFVFIDGDHSYETTLKDLIDYWPLVKTGGVFAGHDINLTSVHNALKEFFKDKPDTKINTVENNAWYLIK